MAQRTRIRRLQIWPKPLSPTSTYHVKFLFIFYGLIFRSHWHLRPTRREKRPVPEGWSTKKDTTRLKKGTTYLVYVWTARLVDWQSMRDHVRTVLRLTYLDIHVKEMNHASRNTTPAKYARKKTQNTPHQHQPWQSTNWNTHKTHTQVSHTKINHMTLKKKNTIQPARDFWFPVLPSEPPFPLWRRRLESDRHRLHYAVGHPHSARFYFLSPAKQWGGGGGLVGSIRQAIQQ